MGDKPADSGPNEPSLKLPSLFGRRKNAQPEAPGAEPAAGEPVPREPAAEVSSAATPDLASTRPRLSLPAIPGRVAAIITGLVVGAFGTMLTYLGLAGCEAVKGTDSCGGPGFFLLVGILVLMILLGTVLLTAWKVSEPGGTSFLAVALVTVVALVTLIEVIFSAWMFLFVPVIGAAAYALSHWVTTMFVAEGAEGPPQHDVR